MKCPNNNCVDGYEYYLPVAELGQTSEKHICKICHGTGEVPDAGLIPKLVCSTMSSLDQRYCDGWNDGIAAQRDYDLRQLRGEG